MTLRRPRKTAPIVAPVMPPADELATTRSSGVGEERSHCHRRVERVAGGACSQYTRLIGQGARCRQERQDKPLNVPPSANHWIPDAAVKRAGVGEDRRTAATPPVRRPVVPGRRLAKGNHTPLNSLLQTKRERAGIYRLQWSRNLLYQQ